MGSIVIASLAPSPGDRRRPAKDLPLRNILCGCKRRLLELNRGDRGRWRTCNVTTSWRSNRETREPVPRLRLSDTDHEFFESRILEQPSKFKEDNAVDDQFNKRIDAAYKLAHEYVNKAKDGSRDPVKESSSGLLIL